MEINGRYGIPTLGAGAAGPADGHGRPRLDGARVGRRCRGSAVRRSRARRTHRGGGGEPGVRRRLRDRRLRAVGGPARQRRSTRGCVGLRPGRPDHADRHRRRAPGPIRGRVRPQPGDVPDFGGGERAEVQSDAPGAVVHEGDERWYQWSMKFPADFQNPTGVWFIVMQWHAGIRLAAARHQHQRRGHGRHRRRRAQGRAPPHDRARPARRVGRLHAAREVLPELATTGSSRPGRTTPRLCRGRPVPR